MAFGYDVIYTLGQDIGHADAMSRSRFEDDKDNLVAVALATSEKSAVDVEKSGKAIQSNEITKRNMNRFRSGYWKTVPKWRYLF